MNIYRPCAVWHINYPDHYMLEIRVDGAVKRLAYCYEVGKNGVSHTHIVLVLLDKITKKNLLSIISETLPPDKSIDQVKAVAHNHEMTPFHDHLGLNEGKARCSDFFQVEGLFDADAYIRERVMRRPRTSLQTKEQTKTLLNNNLADLTLNGDRCVGGYRRMKDDLNLFKSDLVNRTKMELKSGDFLENTWNLMLEIKLSKYSKRRHFFFHSVQSNRGKSFFIDKLEEKYRTARPSIDGWWDIDEGAQLVLCDPTTVEKTMNKGGMLNWGSIEDICNGSKYFNRKSWPVYRSTIPLVLVICSNQTPEELWGRENMPYFETRFHVYDLATAPLCDVDENGVVTSV